jgi:hypothetical protein
MLIDGLLTEIEEVAYDRPTDKYTRTLPFIGCTVALDKNLARAFPSMAVGILAEDAVLYRRAYLMNGIKYIPKILVKYRVGYGIGVSSPLSSSAADYKNYTRKWAKDTIVKSGQILADRKNIGCVNEKVESLIRCDISKNTHILKIIEGSPTSSLHSILTLLFVKSNLSEILFAIKVFFDCRVPVAFNLIKFIQQKIKLDKITKP